MSAFWRPITVSAPDRLPTTTGPGSRGGTLELWCRCELCQWSGPFVCFVAAWSGERNITPCEKCMGDEGTVAVLLREGWVIT